MNDLFKKDSKQYFAKYLTNEKLMDLQLSDPNFRRYFLLQCLVLFQYLTGTVRFKNANQTMSESQTTWITTTTTKLYQLLAETPPDGETFARTCQHVLEREENWINWKNESCPSFAKTTQQEQLEEGEESSAPVAKKPRKYMSIGDDYKSNRTRKINMGTSELSRLWNICPDNTEACKQKNRLQFLPTLKDFFEDAFEQADPEAGIEEEYKLVNNDKFGWRSLRLLSRRSQHFFTPTPNQTQHKGLPDFLNSVLIQLSKEFSKESGDATQPDGGAQVNGTASDASSESPVAEQQNGTATPTEQLQVKEEIKEEMVEV